MIFQALAVFGLVALVVALGLFVFADWLLDDDDWPDDCSPGWGERQEAFDRIKEQR